MKDRATPNPMGFLKTYIRMYGRQFTVAVAILLVEAIADLLQPALLARIVDVGVANHNLDAVLAIGAAMLGVTLVGAVAAITRNILANRISLNFGARLRSDLFRKIQGFSFENLDKFETASLVTRLTNDVTNVQNFAGGLMRIIVKAPLVGIGALIMAAVLNFRLTLLILAAVAVVAGLIWLSITRAYPFYRRVQTMIDRINSALREYVSGVRVVKAFNRFDFETARFADRNADLSNVTQSALRIMAIFTPLISFSLNLAILAVLWFGARQIQAGSMQVGQIIAFVNYITQILFALVLVSMVFVIAVRARASTERIGEVLAETTGLAVRPTAQPAAARALTPTVEFERVWFSYQAAAGRAVVDNVSFSCPAGARVGILGATGAGKTSLVNLIPRFYDPQSGRVLLGGVDVSSLELNHLRQYVAIVPQKSLLFSGSILENIRWGKPGASLAEVEQAARCAGAHEFVSGFGEGYATRLGQGGVNLSGGQKQRIAIARALVRQPAILILDDSTSAVDVATEAAINQAIRSHFSGMTCFIIAQRISSVQDTDQIMVLDQGCLVGQGTHRELLAGCAVYQDIYRSQVGSAGVDHV